MLKKTSHENRNINIYSSKVNIKLLEHSNLETLRKLRNDHSTNRFLTKTLYISKSQQEDWFQRLKTEDKKIYLQIENNSGNFIGIVRCDEWDNENKSVRIGVDIIPQERRKGYATEVYLLLFKYFFEVLKVNRIWLLVLEYNKPAINLYKKLGFKLEGKQREAIYRDKKFYDYLMMSLLKKEYEKGIT